ncbi:MAG: IS256 family transposase, partial [Solirubrobacteraceae bacterium]
MSDVRTPQTASVLEVGPSREEVRLTLDDLAREGALRMIAAALEAEVDQYVASFAEERDEDGKRLVVRNGKANERKLTVGSGTLAIRAPRVNDKRIDEESGERRRFSSRILPAYARRSPKVTEVLPILYLHGLSTGDFAPALRDLLGEDASGLSPSSIQRLTEAWQAEHAEFRKRELRFHRYAYLFVDGVNVAVRLGEDAKVCLLVVIGVREDGCKELLAVEDGYRESEDSWAAVFRDLRDRGMGEPKLVTGDGALGAWAALRNVFPAATEQRCWVHKTANVLDALPKRLQPRAKGMLHEMAEAPTRADARKALERFRDEFDAKYPKAVAKLEKDWEALTAFYDFPAEHWRHLRTTNPIESSFATVKLRTKVTKGAGSKKAALAMAYK